ncbi:MAG: APC family permease [Eubacteriaceae bacterium]|jgi:amino acid transporter|nr:APC family permease [Eubacteriaceae bacterium]MDD4508082.1 APC family permease [Eubacteriaceae bacterium]
MKEEKKLGLRNVISVSVGLVIATSCLVSLGQGAGTIGVTFIYAMIIACVLNMITMATMAELNALMPNTTGGLAQYTLAGLGPFPTLISMVGGYLLCNVLSTGVEASIFAYAIGDLLHLPIPNFTYTLIMSLLLLVTNLKGVDVFAKIQDLVAYLMIGSMLVLGIIGALGMGTGQIVDQPAVMSSDFGTIISMTAVAFWLFIGAEYVIPISKDVKNAKRNVPLGMFLGLALICVVQAVLVLGFKNYTPWADLADSAAPHLLYGMNLLGMPGKIWMCLVAALAFISTQNSTINGLASICQGMSKMNMMPRFFAKTNKNDVPFIGVWIITVAILVFAFASADSSDTISFLILVGSTFWMISYIIAHIDLLVFRHRLPKAPRSFKVPGGVILPVIGILGTAFMILNISTDPAEKYAIWGFTGITFLILGVYAFFWIKYKMRIPVFKHVPMQKVLAMENDLFYIIRKRRGIWR